MPDIDKAFEICQRLNENASVTQSDLVNIRRILNEMDRDLKLGEARERGMAANIKAYAERDADKEIADLKDRLKRTNELKEGYSTTLDRAMECVEAVLPQTSHAKHEIEGRGAEFFASATRLLPKWVKEKREAVVSDTVEHKNREANAREANMRAERNEAVRKQLDLEKEVHRLADRVKWFENHDATKKVDEQANRISLLSVELDKSMKQASDLQARVDAFGTRNQALTQTCADVERVCRADVERLGCENDKLHERVKYLTSISLSIDAELVSTLVNTCGHLLTPSARLDRKQAVQAVMGLALQHPRLSQDFESVFAANERHLKWLDAVGKHLGLEHGCCGKWWEAANAVERLRTRIERLTTDSDKAVAALKDQIERLTDVIHELRKEG